MKAPITLANLQDLVPSPDLRRANLLTQDPILGLQVVDELELVAIDPAGEPDQQKLKGLGAHRGHRIGADGRYDRPEIGRCGQRNDFKMTPVSVG